MTENEQESELAQALVIMDNKIKIRGITEPTGKQRLFLGLMEIRGEFGWGKQDYFLTSSTGLDLKVETAKAILKNMGKTDSEIVDTLFDTTVWLVENLPTHKDWEISGADVDRVLDSFSALRLLGIPSMSKVAELEQRVYQVENRPATYQSQPMVYQSQTSPSGYYQPTINGKAPWEIRESIFRDLDQLQFSQQNLGNHNAWSIIMDAKNAITRYLY